MTNRSNFALTGVKLEITWSADNSQSFKMLTADSLPDLPAEEWNFRPSFTGDGGTEVDEEGAEPVYISLLGTVRPGETRRVGEDLAFLPFEPGVYTMKARVLANEISQPGAIEWVLTVDGECKHLSCDDLGALLDTDEDEEFDH